MDNKNYLSRGPLPVITLFALALIARLLFLQFTGWYGQIINNDAHEYLAIADSIRQGAGFALAEGTPTAFRPFGYPILLAGLRIASEDSVAVIQLFQVLIGAGLIFPTYALARQLFDPTVALLTGLGVALHPVLIYLTAVVSPDLIALLAVMFLLWFAWQVTSSEKARALNVILGTISGAVAVLMRPETLLVLWLLPVFLFLQEGVGFRPLRYLLALAVIATALALVPPALRNWQRFGELIPMPTIGGMVFWCGNNAVAEGGCVLPTAENWPDDIPPASMRGWTTLSETQSQRRFYAYAGRWLWENPGDALLLAPQKLYRSWTLSYADQDRAGVQSGALHLLNWAFGAVALGGAVIHFHRRRAATWLLLASIIGWLVKTIVFYGSTRQTSLVLPILIMLAAFCVTYLWRRLRPASRQGLVSSS